MAAQAADKGRASAGPGSRTMAATLLEILTIRGRLADRERAAKSAAFGGQELIDASPWLEPDTIGRMLTAASVEVPVARALGHRLVAPEFLGMLLYAMGMATPEKAYRRVQSLLPREAPKARWTTEHIEGESAQLSYRTHPGSDSRHGSTVSPATRAASCAMRRGMLEAIPTLYGLLPATVEDPLCVARGDSICRYEVEWQRTSRRGLIVGGVIGSTLGVATFAVTRWLDASWQWSAGVILGGIIVSACAAAVGRVRDLSAQLEAVAGTRRGQLALFDQVDDQLAAKLDALARVDAKLDEEPTSFRATLNRSAADSAVTDDATQEADTDPSVRDRSVLSSAQAIHAAAGDLECWFDAQEQKASAGQGAGAVIGAERAQLREIRDWAARITDEMGAGAPVRRTIDLAALVARGIASVRPLLPPSALIRLEAEEGLEPVRCEPVQIEQVVIQLVRNAIEASEAIMEVPEAIVTLQNLRGGVEIAVEDRGAGIESTAVDEVFDPFFGDAPLGSAGGFGLPICLRIVQAHGGELRIEAEDRPGTRVSVFLPLDGSASPDPSDAD
jgi:signal transduction histidine kinase